LAGRTAHNRPMSAAEVKKCPQCGAKNRVPIAAKGKPRCGKCGTAMPWLVSAGDASLDAALDTSSLVVLDLWAPWCGPCRMVAPVLEEIAKDYAGKVKVVKVNVDDAPRTASRFQAQSIPTLVLLQRGHPVDRLVGAQPKTVLTEHINRALSAASR
jgi:thioredoxin 2